MDDFKAEKDILRELIKSREAIKRKYNLLKHERADFEKSMGETLKSVTAPLEKLVNLKSEKLQSSLSLKEEKSEVNTLKNQSKFPRNTELESEIDDSFTTSNVFNSTSIGENTVIDGDPMSLFNESSDGELDKIYGVRKENGKYVLGKTEIKISESAVSVNDVSYPKTNGLMELLIKKRPEKSNYSATDLQNYQNILEFTNAHKKKCLPNTSLRSSKSFKYKEIIEPMFLPIMKTKSTSGSGLLPRYKTSKLTSTTDYVHWDDPNELVDRLRLLISEKSAGNNNHNNEILSIIEELREAGYIY